MTWVALKMLLGSPGKYYSMIFGIAFACMMMAQQQSLFVGLMYLTGSQVHDVHDADFWVMDPSVKYVDDITPLPDDAVYRVRGVPGVAWAVPFYKGLARGRCPSGQFKQFFLLGVDDQSLAGAPRTLMAGSLADLRRADAVMLDERGWQYLFPGEPVQTGRVYEMNDRRAEVVAVCKAAPTFLTYPLVYTRYSQAIRFAPQERRQLSFVLARAEPGPSLPAVCRRVEEQTGLRALPQQEFADRTTRYYMERTGIPVNFGITVTLGFIIGAAIAGQTFYLFTLDNLKQFATLKALGVSNRRLTGMVLLQGLVVGLVGYGMGVGLAAAFESFLTWQLAGSRVLPPTYMAWQILVLSGAAVLLMIAGSALFSLRRVLHQDPAAVMQ